VHNRRAALMIGICSSKSQSTWTVLFTVRTRGSAVFQLVSHPHPIPQSFFVFFLQLLISPWPSDLKRWLTSQTEQTVHRLCHSVMSMVRLNLEPASKTYRPACEEKQSGAPLHGARKQSLKCRSIFTFSTTLLRKVLIVATAAKENPRFTRSFV